MARPGTAQSIARPGTARPMTAASSRNEGSHIIAIVEGRGVSREVGLAALDQDTGCVMIVQVGRIHAYRPFMKC
jgi:DNA mismatch repair protein MSH4